MAMVIRLVVDNMLVSYLMVVRSVKKRERRCLRLK